MLHLIATPIGHRGDLSSRALETLMAADAVYCEDTRHSGPWLRELGVTAPLISLHEHNEAQRTATILKRLEKGEKIALVSDAGMPGVCDPGGVLVRQVREQGLPLTVIPGPCAVITAWAHLGWELPFQFIGFFPQESKEREHLLVELLSYKGATIFYESPHRLSQTLRLIADRLPDRRIAIARELTKIFEEVIEQNSSLLPQWLEGREIRGEHVIVVGPPSPGKDPMQTKDLVEQVNFIECTFNLDRMSAIKIVANINNLSKKEVYKSVNIDP
jgi:16S rRNA (cytidine1402-2'-O)-methyltransferase